MSSTGNDLDQAIVGEPMESLPEGRPAYSEGGHGLAFSNQRTWLKFQAHDKVAEVAVRLVAETGEEHSGWHIASISAIY